LQKYVIKNSFHILSEKGRSEKKVDEKYLSNELDVNQQVWLVLVYSVLNYSLQVRQPKIKDDENIHEKKEKAINLFIIGVNVCLISNTLFTTTMWRLSDLFCFLIEGVVSVNVYTFIWLTFAKNIRACDFRAEFYFTTVLMECELIGEILNWWRFNVSVNALVLWLTKVIEVWNVVKGW
jgi:hypothetical protein